MDKNHLSLAAVQVKVARTVPLMLLDEMKEREDRPLELPALAAAAPDEAITPSARSVEFRQRHFPEATQAQWNDWKWQLRKRIRNLTTLERIFTLSPAERGAIAEMGIALPVGVTPYYASLMDLTDPMEPIRRTMIPVADEFTRSAGEADDPLNEDHDMVTPGLVHRYPDRVLFLDRGRIVEDRETSAFFTEPHTERARQFLSKILHHV